MNEIKKTLYKSKGYKAGDDKNTEDGKNSFNFSPEDENLKRQIIQAMMAKEKENQDVKRIKVDFQISSNMRVCIGLKDWEDPKFIIGNPKEVTFLTEHHIISFERYINMPFAMKMRRQKELKNRNNKGKVEVVNPWLITDIDYTFNLLQNSKK